MPFKTPRSIKRDEWVLIEWVFLRAVMTQLRCVA